MHVLRLAVISGVFGQGYSPLIIAEDDYSQRDGMCRVHSSCLRRYKRMVFAYFFGVNIGSNGWIRRDLGEFL